MVAPAISSALLLVCARHYLGTVQRATEAAGRHGFGDHVLATPSARSRTLDERLYISSIAPRTRLLMRLMETLA
jgi:hypothetical protein